MILEGQQERLWVKDRLDTYVCQYAETRSCWRVEDYGTRDDKKVSVVVKTERGRGKGRNVKVEEEECLWGRKNEWLSR